MFSHLVIFICTSHSVEICQLRLDFIDFLLDNAVAATGTCATDTLTIIPGAIGTNPPIVCGNLVGQHSKQAILCKLAFTLHGKMFF